MRSWNHVLTRIRLALPCLVLFASSLAGCVEGPSHYWVKQGVSQEQIERDNFLCASAAAKKHYVYPHSREIFYTAGVDQSSYKECMVLNGYHLVTKEGLEPEGGVPSPPPPSMAQIELALARLDATRKLCERVVGEAGDVKSCIRWMSVSVNGNPTDTGTLAYEAPADHEDSMTPGETEVCLRQDSNNINPHMVTISRRCD